MKGQEKKQEKRYFLSVVLPTGILTIYGYRLDIIRMVGDLVVNCRDLEHNIIYDFDVVLMDDQDNVLYDGLLYQFFNCMYDII